MEYEAKDDTSSYSALSYIYQFTVGKIFIKFDDAQVH